MPNLQVLDRHDDSGVGTRNTIDGTDFAAADLDYLFTRSAPAKDWDMGDPCRLAAGTADIGLVLITPRTVQFSVLAGAFSESRTNLAATETAAHARTFAVCDDRFSTLVGALGRLGHTTRIAGSAAELVGHIDLEAVAAVSQELASRHLAAEITGIEGFASVDDPTWRQLVFVFRAPHRSPEAQARLMEAFAQTLDTVMRLRPDLANAIAESISAES